MLEKKTVTVDGETKAIDPDNGGKVIEDKSTSTFNYDNERSVVIKNIRNKDGSTSNQVSVFQGATLVFQKIYAYAPDDLKKDIIAIEGLQIGGKDSDLYKAKMFVMDLNGFVPGQDYTANTYPDADGKMDSPNEGKLEEPKIVSGDYIYKTEKIHAGDKLKEVEIDPSTSYWATKSPYKALHLYTLNGEAELPGILKNGKSKITGGIYIHAGNSRNSDLHRTGSQGCQVMPGDTSYPGFINNFDSGSSGIFTVTRPWE